MILQFDIQKPSPGVAVVHFVGPLTLGSSLHAADAELQKAIGEGSAKVVLNMTEVPYMDSAGLGVLVQAAGMANAAGGALRLCGACERVSALLQLTRTDALLPTDSDVNASLAALT